MADMDKVRGPDLLNDLAYRVIVRCGTCAQQRPEYTAPAMMVLDRQEITWGRGDYRWWPMLVIRTSVLAELRRRQRNGGFSTAGGIRPEVKAAFETSPERRAWYNVEPLPVQQALRHKAEPFTLSTALVLLDNPSGGVELSCRESKCRNKPRVKLRELYELAEDAVAGGRYQVFI